MLLFSPRVSAATVSAAAIWTMLVGSSLSQELFKHPYPPCPSCYTSTVWLPPPCARPIFSCTGPSTLPPGGCSSTLDLRPTTFTVPGLNPACPTTPSVTSALNCPTTPPCYQAKCRTVTLGGDRSDAWFRTTITEPPMKCRPTVPVTATATATSVVSFETVRTRTPLPQVPLPSLPPV